MQLHMFPRLHGVLERGMFMRKLFFFIVDIKFMNPCPFLQLAMNSTCSILGAISYRSILQCNE